MGRLRRFELTMPIIADRIHKKNHNKLLFFFQINQTKQHDFSILNIMSS